MLVPANLLSLWSCGTALRSTLHGLPDWTSQHITLCILCQGFGRCLLTRQVFILGFPGGFGSLRGGSGSGLPGIWQKAPRAELHAMLPAVLAREQAYTVTLDVVGTMQHLFRGGLIVDGWENRDLWQRMLKDLVTAGSRFCLRIPV